MFDRIDINQAARLSLGLVVTVAGGIDLATRLDGFPKLVNVCTDLFAVLGSWIGGEERGLFGDEGTLLHQVGQPSPDLHDFVAAQIGQVARCEHHPRMDTAEHIAERLLYLIVLEHSAMFGTESGDRGEVHAHKDTTCFSLVWVLQRPPARTLQNAIIDSQQVEKKEGRKQTEILLKKDFDVEVGLTPNRQHPPCLLSEGCHSLQGDKQK